MKLEFDPDIPSEVEAAYKMVRSLQQPSAEKPKTTWDAVTQLSSFQIIRSAAECFQPEEKFTFDDLAAKTDQETKTVKAHWMQLSRSDIGSTLLQVHEGKPNRYSLTKLTWARVKNQ